MLSIAEYNKLEEQARKRMPNTAIEAFSPVFFQFAGYPSRISEESELFKYIDTMHDLRFDNDYKKLLGGLTEDEFKVLQDLTKLVLNFSKKYFQKEAIARSSILRSLHVFRYITLLYSGVSRPRVLEIGPGCGYLGAMLLLEGYPYAATDVAQAFYLYQEYFWNFITNNAVAADLKEFDSLAAVSLAKAVHIPWWDFAELTPQNISAFEVITCNHALGEMHPNSLKHMLRLAQSSQSKVNSEDAIFLIDGLYGTSINPIENIVEYFYRYGYVLVYRDEKITIFAFKGSRAAAGGLNLPRKGRSLSVLPQDIARKLLGLPSFCKKRQWPLPQYFSAHNIISNKIKSKLAMLLNQKLVPIGHVKEFYSKLIKGDNYLSPDEKFLSSFDQ